MHLQENSTKETLRAEIINSLNQELAISSQAANNAHLAATDEQSVAETQYDTLAIEAGYLAEGQAKRVQEIKTALQTYTKLKMANFNNESQTNIGALIQLTQDAQSNKRQQPWFFLGPAVGGFRTEIGNKLITVVTPHSPMGAALMHKLLDDEISVQLAGETFIDYINAIE